MKQGWQEVALEVEDAYKCMFYNYLVGFGTGALSSASSGTTPPSLGSQP